MGSGRLSHLPCDCGQAVGRSSTPLCSLVPPGDRAHAASRSDTSASPTHKTSSLRAGVAAKPVSGRRGSYVRTTPRTCQRKAGNMLYDTDIKHWPILNPFCSETAQSVEIPLPIPALNRGMEGPKGRLIAVVLNAWYWSRRSPPSWEDFAIGTAN